MKTHRVLYRDDSPESEKVSRLFKENNIEIADVKIDPKNSEFIKLPVLISGEGQWEGAEEVRRYVQSRKIRPRKG